MKNVIAMYPDLTTAETVVDDLIRAGVPRDRISIVSHHASERYRDLSTMSDDQRKSNAAKAAGTGLGAGAIGGILASLGLAALPGIGWVLAAGPIGSMLASGGIGAAVGAATFGLGGALSTAGVPDDRAHGYAEGVRRGGAMIAAEVDDGRAPQVAAVMEAYAPIDIDRSAKRWTEQDRWTGKYDEKKAPFRDAEVERERNAWRQETGVTASAAGSAGARTATPGDKTIPVIQEEVEIGKRTVDRGGVRVHTYVVTEPVERDVRLREEQVDVERRTVNRPAGAAERGAAFRDDTIEVTATGEEAVVGKTARVVEEVSVRKTSSERTQHISETARHTQVDVERLSAKDVKSLEPTWRAHHGGLKGAGSYDSLRPAYEMGATWGRTGRGEYRELEPQMRLRWEAENKGLAWDQARGPCQFAFEECRKARA